MPRLSNACEAAGKAAATAGASGCALASAGSVMASEFSSTRSCWRCWLTASYPRLKPRRLACARVLAARPSSSTASKSALMNGNAPLPAIQPSMVALTTVPASRVSRAMSITWWARLLSCTSLSSWVSSRLPSPISIFSSVVKARADDVMTKVRSLEGRPLVIWRAVSSNSLETNTSSLPGSGFSPKTGRLRPSSARGTGNTSR